MGKLRRGRDQGRVTQPLSGRAETWTPSSQLPIPFSPHSLCILYMKSETTHITILWASPLSPLRWILCGLIPEVLGCPPNSPSTPLLPKKRTMKQKHMLTRSYKEPEEQEKVSRKGAGAIEKKKKADQRNKWTHIFELLLLPSTVINKVHSFFQLILTSTLWVEINTTVGPPNPQVPHPPIQPTMDQNSLFDPQLGIRRCGESWLYALFYTVLYRGLQRHRFWYPQGVWKQTPSET